MEYRFTTEFAESKIDEIVHFLLGPRLWVPATDYPDFLDWADRCVAQLKHQHKRAVLCMQGMALVGVALYQRHKQYADTLEIKNLTVLPQVRGRYIASFLLRNAEVEGQRDFASQWAVGDAKSTNYSVAQFMTRHHYAIADQRDLYQKGAGQDLVFRKKLGPVESSLFQAEARA